MKISKMINSSLVGMIEEGCTIEGKITFDGSLRLNGNFKGDILGEGALLVGSHGKAEANIHVSELIVEGELRGSVNATTKVEIHKGGRLLADVSTKSLIIEEGGMFHGKSSMDAEEPRLVKTEIETPLEKGNWKKAKNS